MRDRAIVGVCLAAAVAVAALAAASDRGAPGAFQHPPLDGPLILTGTFGEYRPGRFHGGLDYSTGGHVGAPVYAPLDGTIERVRASGAGYGRSIYLKTSDGRLIVFGHFDAYDQPFASYVAAAQDSSGQYEQDLWPEPGRFRVRAGQRLGWSGQSGGVGEPHLHLEVRYGDMAVHPLLVGASAEDTIAPVIAGIMIEPRTPVALINGRSAPLRLGSGARPETVSVSGLVRFEVEAHDPGTRRSDMQPYEIELTWANHRLACRFDSLSWATDMIEGDLVYDRGRLFDAPAHAVLMWAPAGFRPRAIVTDVPLSEEAGTIPIDQSTRPVRVVVIARDFAGHSAQREFVLIFDRSSPADHASPALIGPCLAKQGDVGDFNWRISADAGFGQGTGCESVSAETLGVQTAAGDLIPVGNGFHLGPDWLALRKPFELRARVPDAHPDRQLGLYVRRDSNWELVGTESDSTRSTWIFHPPHLGRFAFFEDRLAPRIRALRPPRHAGGAKPYSKWVLEARLMEAGSGVDTRACYFVVDRKRRPSEWDGVHQTLRWRPLRAPGHGVHRYVVVATDRAGNARRASGRFVLD